MSRPFFPVLMLILLGVALAPLFLHPTDLLYPRTGQATDLTITHWPAVAFNVRTLRQDGQVPLWRTTIAGGGPWAANPQSWLFYPPAWLFYLPGMPIGLTFNLLLVAHLALAALGTYAFGRRALGLGAPGAALAGLAFALAPWLSGQLAAGHVNIILALAWLPVALGGAHHAATTGRPGGALLTGLAWAAALLNHAQMAAFAIALSAGWLGLTGLAGRAGISLRRLVALLLLMFAAALLLGAALLIPLAEAMPHLNRMALTADEAGLFSLSWAGLLTGFIPTYGGEPEQIIYLGLPVALLGAVGLALRRDRASCFLVATALLAALFALGNHGPLFPLLLRLVPGMSWLRVPPRAWVLVAFSLALLAGRGLDALTGVPLAAPARRRTKQIALAALLFGLLLSAGLFFLYRPTPPAVWSLAVLSVAGSVALLIRARGHIGARPFALAILLLTAADLGLVHAAWTTMRTPAEAFAWGGDVARFLVDQDRIALAQSGVEPGLFRVYSPSYSLPQHTAVEHGLSLASGVDPFQLRSYAAFLALAGGYRAEGYSPSLPPRLDDSSARPDAARLGLLNVRYVVSGFSLAAEDLALLAQIGPTYIYRNERFLPRAFVVSWPQVSSEGTLSRSIQATPAHIAIYTPNRIVVEAEADGPALLVLSELWYPGWRATVDGIRVPIQPIENLLRGVRLAAGRHTVEFRYSPWTVWVGLAVSGGAALALLVYAMYGLTRLGRNQTGKNFAGKALERRP